MKTLFRPTDSDSMSLFIGRRDDAVADQLPAAMRSIPGAMASKVAFRSHRDVLDSDRCQRLINYGGVPQRLLFASTNMKGPKAPGASYIDALAAPNAVNATLAPTLTAFSDHGEAGRLLQPGRGDDPTTIAWHTNAGVDVDVLANRLQSNGVQAVVESWKDSLGRIDAKSSELGSGRS